MLAANKRGLDAYQRGDYGGAARYFREALRYVDHERVRANLEHAEDRLREAAEERQRQAEAQRREAEASAAIRQGVERLASLLGTSPPERAAAGMAPSPAPGSGLDFLRDASSSKDEECVGGRASVPNSDPNVVDLRCAGTLTVDPARVKGAPPLEFAKTLEVPMRDAVADRTKSTEPGANETAWLDELDSLAWLFEANIVVPPPAARPAEREASGWQALRGNTLNQLSGLAGQVRSWLSDPMHRQWLKDAGTIAFLPLMVRSALAAGSRAITAGEAAGGPKHVFLTEEAFKRTELRGRNIIYHIQYPDGFVKEVGWRIPARITGPVRAPVAASAASGPPQHVFLTADEWWNIDVNARNIVYHIQQPDGTVKTMEWLVDYKHYTR